MADINERCLERAEELGWWVNRSTQEIGMDSDAGEDFSFDYDPENVEGSISEYVGDFSVADHVALWAHDDRPFGYDIEAAYDDAMACMSALEDTVCYYWKAQLADKSFDLETTMGQMGLAYDSNEGTLFYPGMERCFYLDAGPHLEGRDLANSLWELYEKNDAGDLLEMSDSTIEIGTGTPDIDILISDARSLKGYLEELDQAMQDELQRDISSPEDRAFDEAER